MAVISRLACDDGNANAHVGHVKLVNKNKGYGFIHCEDVFRKYNSDVFVSLKELIDYGIGDAVTFLMTLNSRGQPQGRNLQASQDQCEGSTYVGILKSIDANGGYAFIACKDTFQAYKRDVFVHSSELLSFQQGDEVSFMLKETPYGQPQAYRLRAALKSECWLASDQFRTDEPKTLGTHEGEIKSANEASGYGFIRCAHLREQFSCDVFFPTALMVGLAVGDRVEFEAREKDGHVQAYAIRKGEVATSAVNAGATPAANTIAICLAENRQNDQKAALTKKLLRACASARKESYREMFLLLNDGADPNGRDVTDQTALMVAALNDGGGEKKCRLLIGMGADIYNVYRDGLTIVDWARERIGPSFASHLEALHRGDAEDCLIVLNTMGASEI